MHHLLYRSLPVVLLGFFVVFSILGCEYPEASAQVVAQDSSAAIEAIMEQSRRLSEAYVRGDIEALVSVYTPDGVAIPGGRDYVRGRDDLLSLWELPEGRTIIRHASMPLEIKVEGDYAYDWGYYEGQGARDGEPLNPFRGIYVIVWERGEDDTWRIAVDMWNSLPGQHND